MKTREDMKTFKGLRHQPEHETGRSPVPTGLGPALEAPSSSREEVQLDTPHGVNKGLYGSSPVPDLPVNKLQEEEDPGHLFIWRVASQRAGIQVEGSKHG